MQRIKRQSILVRLMRAARAPSWARIASITTAVVFLGTLVVPALPAAAADRTTKGAVAGAGVGLITGGGEGAVKGALVGAGVGALSDSNKNTDKGKDYAKKGAAAGAGVGLLSGGVKGAAKGAVYGGAAGAVVGKEKKKNP